MDGQVIQPQSQKPQLPVQDVAPQEVLPAKPAKPSSGSLKKVVLVVIAILLIGGAAFGAYKWENKRASRVEKGEQNQINSLQVQVSSLQKQVSSAKSSSSTPNPYTGWQTATFAGEKLYLRYPSGWQPSIDSTTQDLLLKKSSGSGNFIISLGWAADGLVADATATTNNKPISIFSFDGQTGYIVSDSLGGAYDLSSCPAPKWCLFAPKLSTQFKGINEELTYSAPNQQEEVVLPKDSTTISEAVKIMSSLSY